MELANSSLSVFLVVIWLWLVVQVHAQNRSDEVQALTSFRKGLHVNNDSFQYWFTWNENDENACAWVGVSCTGNFTVTSLDLSNFGITYVDSLAALSELPDLLLLDMSSNDINATIPDDIGSLTQLTRLDLSRNFFYGQIPTNISSFRSLRYLSLEQNLLDGPIPDLSEMVHLQFLLLAGNKLNGSFPKELGEISSLLTIDLSRNQLYGFIPSLPNATDLVNLKLDNNIFEGIPPYVNAPNLQEWDLSWNALAGQIPVSLTNLPHLQLFNMSHNNFAGGIPNGFFNQSSNQVSSLVFDLSQNFLSGEIPLGLLQPPVNGVLSINLSHNNLTGGISGPTVTASNIVLLDLSNNLLHGPISSQVMGIQYLYLGNNYFSADIVDSFFDNELVSVIEELHLGNNLFTGDLSRMTYKWANCTSLNVVDLSNNDLSWTMTESIPDPMTAAMENFPSVLKEFRVGGNNFSGTSLPLGPLSLAQGGQSNLEVLDLSNNQLKGMISGVVFSATSFPSLVFLNLSHNEATGPVPEAVITFFNKKATFGAQGMQLSTKVLDLSNNKLSGPLPFIPLSNSTLTNPSFFTGNDGLCGYPLPQCSQHGTRLQLWVLLTHIGGSVLIATGSCVVATWKWRVYHKLHKQDEDLIKTLVDRESATLMPLRDLKRATNNFCDSLRIGEGGFGTVYMGQLNNGSQVAIKRSKREGSEEDKRQFLNEVRILSQVNHRHLVKLLGCCMENKVSLLIFEFVSNGTLQEHLQGKIGDVGLSWKQRLNIAVQTADALNYLHTGTNFPIYHRDVKSANILLNDDLSTKVADFGISKLAPMQATHISTAGMGTIGYMDPEYYTYHRLTDRSDVYSFGVVLLELISAKPAIFQIDGEPVNVGMFAGSHIESGDMRPLIDPALLETYNDASGHCKESILNVGRLAMKCLAMPSKERPNMNEVWKELQDLCLKLEMVDLGSLREDVSIQNQWWNDGELFSQSFSNHSHSLEMQNDPSPLRVVL